MLLPDCIKVTVGHVRKTHGVKGELSVTLEPDFDMPLEQGDPVIFEIDGLDVPFFISSVRARGAESILLMLDEVRSESEAAMLAGKEIFIYADSNIMETDADDDDELTADRLVGYTIMDGETEVGRIDDVREVGPDCWYFVIEGSGKLIPIADEMIGAIDSDSKIVEMELPEGLLDL